MMILKANLSVFFLLYFYPFHKKFYFQAATHTNGLFLLLIRILFFEDNYHNHPSSSF